MTCPWLHWTTDNLSGMHMVSISTPVCVNFELRPGAGDIHICWFNFDALAQGNAYKPTKEPINYRGPGGDRTHDLQTEATPPAASCPARTLHATEIAPKNATPMTCPWLHWTTDNLSGMHMVSISTPVCVNFELRPGHSASMTELMIQQWRPYYWTLNSDRIKSLNSYYYTWHVARH